MYYEILFKEHYKYVIIVLYHITIGIRRKEIEEECYTNVLISNRYLPMFIKFKRSSFIDMI